MIDILEAECQQKKSVCVCVCVQCTPVDVQMCARAWVEHTQA